MRWNRFSSRLLALALLLCPLVSMAQQQRTDTLASMLKYSERLQRYRNHWASLIPTQFVVQNAGNMGVISMGIGWSYGRHRQWETQMLWGYIPKYQSTRGKLTTTLKENFIPWSIAVAPQWQVRPLSASIYINTVYGHEFWRSQPSRYPDSYYDFMSTKFRLNIALGQQLTWQIPRYRRKFSRSITVFYELSSCDLYLRSRILDRSVKVSDIVGLSLGVKLQY